jgi:hypothetical protein
VVVSLSQYKYGNKNTSANAPNVYRRVLAPRLSHEAVSEEVANIRNSIDNVNDILLDISELSVQVQQELEGLEESLVNLEAQL